MDHMQLGISEILQLVEKAENTEDKILLLRKYDNTVLRDVLIYTFHPNIKFLLPEGDMPEGSIKFNILPDCHGLLYSQIKRMYLFVEGGHQTLSQIKRESMWISLLETVDQDDAKLLIKMKDKKLPYESITPSLINQAFGNLIPIIEPSIESVLEKPSSKVEENPPTKKPIKKSTKKSIENING